MSWKNADLLELSIPLRGKETILSTVQIPGFPPASLAPQCLPYSPEFEPTPQEKGEQTLDRIANITGGNSRLDLAGIWNEIPEVLTWYEIAPWLLGLAIVLFLGEILQRRTGLLTQFSLKKQVVAQSPKPTEDTSEQKSPKSFLPSISIATIQKFIRSRKHHQTPLPPVKQKLKNESFKPKKSPLPAKKATLTAMKKASQRAKERRK